MPTSLHITSWHAYPKAYLSQALSSKTHRARWAPVYEKGCKNGKTPQLSRQETLAGGIVAFMTESSIRIQSKCILSSELTYGHLVKFCGHWLSQSGKHSKHLEPLWTSYQGNIPPRNSRKRGQIHNPLISTLHLQEPSGNEKVCLWSIFWG